MKKQYHFVLDTTNPRESAIINFLETFKESRGMKSVLVAAFEVYMGGAPNVNKSEITNSLKLNAQMANVTENSKPLKAQPINDSDFSKTDVADIPDDILDLIDNLG